VKGRSTEAIGALTHSKFEPHKPSLCDSSSLSLVFSHKSQPFSRCHRRLPPPEPFRISAVSSPSSAAALAPIISSQSDHSVPLQPFPPSLIPTQHFLLPLIPMVCTHSCYFDKFIIWVVLLFCNHVPSN
jgi:hypothetical protein